MLSECDKMLLLLFISIYLFNYNLFAKMCKFHVDYIIKGQWYRMFTNKMNKNKYIALGKNGELAWHKTRNM